MLAATHAPLMLLVGDHTRDTGIAVYSAAAVLCFLVAWRAHHRRVPGTGFWLTMGVLNALLAREVPYCFRFQVTNWMRHLFAWLDTGIEKRLLQLGFLVVVGVLFLIAVLVVLFRQETPRSRRIALFGFLVALLAWMVEAVSLHQTSPILYERLGPLVLVAWVWVASAVFTAVGAFAALRGVP